MRPPQVDAPAFLGVSTAARDVVARLLVVDASARATTAEALSFPWFVGALPISNPAPAPASRALANLPAVTGELQLVPRGVAVPALALDDLLGLQRTIAGCLRAASARAVTSCRASRLQRTVASAAQRGCGWARSRPHRGVPPIQPSRRRSRRTQTCLAHPLRCGGQQCSAAHSSGRMRRSSDASSVQRRQF